MLQIGAAEWFHPVFLQLAGDKGGSKAVAAMRVAPTLHIVSRKPTDNLLDIFSRLRTAVAKYRKENEECDYTFHGD